jgi:general secretion pathway protein J
MTNRRQLGLTLVELLVALLVFSFVGAACVYSLRFGVDARNQLASAQARLSQKQLARLIIKEDLAQFVDRPVRDEFGESATAAFKLGAIQNKPRRNDERVILSFVRSGWLNPGDEAPRSELQYVEYVVRDNFLLRRTRPYLDDARGQSRSILTLMSEAGDIRLQALTGEMNGRLLWLDDWPQSEEALAPMAVRLTYRSRRWGELEELYWIGRVGSGSRESDDSAG